MSTRYRYDRRLPRNRKKHLLIILSISMVVLLLGGFLLERTIKNSLKQNNTSDINGPTVSAGKVLGVSTTSPSHTIDEPLFTMTLPDNWREVSSVTTATQNSITWQPSTGTSRWLTVYIDKIPSNIAVNRLLPLTDRGRSLVYGTLSDNCATFASEPINTTSGNPVLAKWNGVDFYCDLAGKNDGQVGTGSAGSINSTTVTGPKTGSHRYFFVYVDRSSEPDYDTFCAALNSFIEK